MKGIERVKNSKWSIFAVASMANLISSFGVNSLVLALPSIAESFGVSQADVSWLTLVYSLIPCCLLLFFGRTAEIYGYRRQMAVGFVVFCLVSVLTPLVSRTVGTLILMRCFQGVAYSILISITQAVVSQAFPPHERGKALGTNTAFVSVGLAAGPTVGGLLLTHFSWRALFYFNIPFTVLGFIATLLVMPPDAAPEKRNKLDFVGALLFALTVGSLSTGLNALKNARLRFIPSPLYFLTAAAALAVFILWERGRESPLIPLSLFKNRSFTQSNISNATSYMAQQMLTYLMPFYLVNQRGLSSDLAGFIILANPIVMILLAPSGGSLRDRLGTKPPAMIGLTLFMLTMLFFSSMGMSTPIYLVVLTLAAVGLANALSVSPINARILSSAPAERRGVASGMLASMRTLGQTLGVAFCTIILETRQSVYLERMTGPDGAYLLAQRDAFLFAALPVLIAMTMIFLLPKEE